MTPQEFYQLLAQQGFELTDRQKDQFERYFELLVEWNEKINLTAITEKNEVYLKHFYDSIAPVLQAAGHRSWGRLSQPPYENHLPPAGCDYH